MELFAQGGGGGPPPQVIWGAIAAGCFCYLLVPALVSLVLYFFLRTLSRALDLCSPDLRVMEPGQVWLNFIPFFNLVWLFVTVIRMGDSLKLEFADRHLDDEEGESTYGKTLGLAGLMLLVLSCGSCCLPIPMIAPNAPAVALGAGAVRTVVSIAWLVLLILYWVRIAGYGRQLADDDDRHYAEQDDRPPSDEEPANDHRPSDPPPLPPGDGR